MNEIFEKFIEKEIPKEEDTDNNYWKEVKSKSKHIHICTVWRCSKCHPNSKPLTKEELIRIRAKIQKRKRPRKLKECSHEWCDYCQRYIKKANHYISLENREIERENEKEKELKSAQKIDQDISMEEPLPNHYTPNINDFERIKVLGGGNCAFRAILKTAGLEPEEWPNLRKITAQKIREFNWNKDTLEALNYSDPEELAQKVENTNSFIGYEELTPLLKYYNIKCYIYLSDDKYKKNKWLEINKCENNNHQETIHLWLHQ